MQVACFLAAARIRPFLDIAAEYDCYFPSRGVGVRVSIT